MPREYAVTAVPVLPGVVTVSWSPAPMAKRAMVMGLDDAGYRKKAPLLAVASDWLTTQSVDFTPGVRTLRQKLDGAGFGVAEGVVLRSDVALGASESGDEEVSALAEGVALGDASGVDELGTDELGGVGAMRSLDASAIGELEGKELMVVDARSLELTGASTGQSSPV